MGCATQDTNEADPVTSGDIIYLELNEGASVGGYLLGDMLGRCAGIQGHPWLFGADAGAGAGPSAGTDGSAPPSELGESEGGGGGGGGGGSRARPVPLGFEDLAFRVVPKLKYAKMDELAEYEQAKVGLARGQSRGQSRPPPSLPPSL